MIIELEDDIQFETLIMTVNQKKGGGSILEILLKLLPKRK